MTNYDRIRNMFVKDIVEQLIKYSDDWDDYCTHDVCFIKYEDALEKEIE